MTRRVPRAAVVGLGSCLPARSVDNEEVIAEGGLDSSDEWIRRRTGIHRRRRAAPGTATGDLAVYAAAAAIESAAIRDLFARTPPSVTSAKGALGHTMGAAGAIEAALTVCTLRTGTVPPTANHDAPGPDTAGIDLVTGAPRRHAPRLALSHSIGFGGHNTVLALRR
ncbi:beta-ketoacyl synthase-like protein [Kitasatospora sp. SolWspMP-SS2h]|uniref:hypothetical protein n=1 Tax=Kitasatospora sp. SolWspMP-SS2h TaxID=1305729 RepID=UPI000DBFDC9D|nr:beta-ketoacyl synthase-like protein [Kitasatospora sp. SolWspMP-SS2h]